MSSCVATLSDDGAVCARHGGAWSQEGCLTAAVLADVAEHREWQYGQYGPNRDVPDGTGPKAEWLQPVENNYREDLPHATAADILDLFRAEWDYDNSATDEEKEQFRRDCTWLRMVREEVAEAFVEDDPHRLEAELIQVAALAVSWVEKIRERRTWQYGTVRRDGSVYAHPGWDSPADAYHSGHGFVEDGKGGRIDLRRRHPGGEWQEVPR